MRLKQETTLRLASLAASICFLFVTTSGIARDEGFISVGVAKIDITPRGPVVLAGYGSRTEEHEGIDSPLWARVLVIGDQQPHVLVALDSCGVTKEITDELARQVEDMGVQKDHLIVAATHTHNAPNLVGYAPILWQGRLSEEQQENMNAYTTFLLHRMEQAITEALDDRVPMKLEWGQGRVGFGGNRRVLQEGQWTGFGFQRDGPVDHSLPMLVARSADGDVQAVWVNYACHCTTVGSRNRVGGDWAGFANDAIEEHFPDAIALTTIGCGADIGPQPSGSLDIAAQHGQTIADEVIAQVGNGLTPIGTPPQSRSANVELPLAFVPDRDHWEQLKQRDGFDRQLAISMLETMDAHGSLPDSVNYPIHAWTFGDDLVVVFLAGEVVVDYSVRLNHDLDWSRLWLTAWANEMPGYIPSARVLAEGGYEAEFSQVYYDHPAPYEPAIEDEIVQTVVDLVGLNFRADENQTPAPFLEQPSNAPLAFERVRDWVTSDLTESDQQILEWLQRYAPQAISAIEPSSLAGGEQTEWHNFAGDFVQRRFIRQLSTEAELRWRVPEVASEEVRDRVYVFLGGTGWASQPSTDGFELYVDEAFPIRFDVTRTPWRARSSDDRVELVYLPTWQSNEDSAGFFFLRIIEPQQASPETIHVRSIGEGSMRWFAVDRFSDSTDSIDDAHARLVEALRNDHD